MDVIEITRQLGKAIQADERYIDYVNAKSRNDEDKELQELIGEFNLIRQNVAFESGKPRSLTTKCAPHTTRSWRTRIWRCSRWQSRAWTRL